MSPLSNVRTRPRVWASTALVTAGLAGGAVLGTTLSAGAAATSSSTGSAATSPAAPGTNGAAPAAPNGQAPADGRPCSLPKTGTVTAVGSNSVTIDGTTYSVTGTSDIDKNGEAKLSDLAVGDKVTFSTVAGASTPTIDRLHAGNEALDRPAGPPPGAPPAGSSQPGTGSSSSSSGSTGT